MEFFKKTTRIDFLAKRSLAAIISLLLFCLSMTSIGFKGLNWGVDFTGGMQAQLSFKQPISLAIVQQKLKATSLPEAKIQHYGTRDLLATFVGVPFDEATQQTLKSTLKSVLSEATVQRLDFIGPKEGRTLLIKGVFALLMALVVIMLYIIIRFEFRLAIGAAAALIHDPILTLGFFSWYQIEFNLVALAGLLTVIAYSLNNIIVIFDRIRENFQKKRLLSNSTFCLNSRQTTDEERSLLSVNEYRNQAINEEIEQKVPFRKKSNIQEEAVSIINISINETLSRTLITSGITLGAVGALYLFGGHELHSFALTLIIGILVGSVSAVYIAGGLAIALGLNQHHMQPRPFSIDDKP